MQRPSAFFTAAPMVLCWLIGFVIGGIAFAPGRRTPEEFTAREKQAAVLTQPLWPLTMTLRVVSPEQFKRESPFPALAFSKPNYDPCEITIPDTWSIVVSPSNPYPGSAHWKDPIDGDILAHEVLHCYRGFWHEQ